jgi:nucleoside-diphosphate-sugar epimerase
MKKKILIIGSSGYIGNQIYKKLLNFNQYDIVRYSSKEKKFIDNPKLKDKNFKIIIFAAGIHTTAFEKNIFLENREILKSLNIFLKKNSRCIFVSSFKTSINSNKKKITSNTLYNLYNCDTDYGKNKILSEKIIKKIFKFKNIKYKIVSPSHVIGPSKILTNHNNILIKKIYNSFINFYPSCYLSFIDVRDLADNIIQIIEKNNFDNKKVILNTTNIMYKNYIEKIKQNQFFLSFGVNNTFVRLIYLISLITSKINKNLNFISKFQLDYILSSRLTVIKKKIIKNYQLKQTINDVIKNNI